MPLKTQLGVQYVTEFAERGNYKYRGVPTMGAPGADAPPGT